MVMPSIPCTPRASEGEMEPESLYNLLQLPKVTGPPAEEDLPQGEKKKYLPPTSRQDPKFEELQKVLMEWINAKLFPEHIVVRSLEEDIFDGLILHHLFQMLTGLKLEVEEMALTAPSQRRKLEVVLEAINGSLQMEEGQLKWSVGTIFSKDLLATLHLLVALAKHFQPDLPLPANVQVEVITMESTKSGLKSEKSVEQLTECRAPREEAVFPSDSVRLRDLPVTQLLGGPDLAPPPKPKLQGLEMSLGNLSGKVSSVRDATFLPACGPTVTLLCPFMNSQLREGSPLAPSWLRAARGRLALRHPDSC